MDASGILQAIVLGAVQGVAEFLPISSSGHLVIVGAVLEELTGGVITKPDLTLNVALHVGTLGSIVAVYHRTILGLIRQPRVCLAIIVATIPVGVVGLTLADVIESRLQSPLCAGIALLVTASLLLIAQRRQAGLIELSQIGIGRALLVGLFQAVAIVPGVSRSGSTIAGGLLNGFTRETAATFSFLIAIPAIAGAGLKETLDSQGIDSGAVMAAAAGAATSFVVGYFSLKWLLGVVSRGRLHWFAVYCAAVGLLVIAWQVVA